MIYAFRRLKLITLLLCHQPLLCCWPGFSSLNSSLFVVPQIAAICLLCRFNILSSMLSKQTIYGSVRRVDSDNLVPLFSYAYTEKPDELLTDSSTSPLHTFMRTLRHLTRTFINIFKAWPLWNDSRSQYLSCQFCGRLIRCRWSY